MLTRAKARATNTHIFVDDKWNDAYIQTKDEQIEMLHAQRVLKSWEDEEDSEDDADADDEGDADRWISEDDESDHEQEDEEHEDDDDDDKEEEAARKKKKKKKKNTGGVGAWLAGGGLLENALWTAAAAAVVPVALYAGAARCAPRRRKRRDAWPLQSRSLAGTLVKAYANVATVAVLLGVVAWGVCGDFAPPSATLVHWRSLRRPAACAATFADDWRGVLSTMSTTTTTTTLALAPQRLLLKTALVAAAASLLTRFHRLWLKSLVLLTAAGALGTRVASQLRAEQRRAIEIVSLDPRFAFANESIFIAVDGQNLEQGATVAWVPYWGGLQHLQAAECDKLLAQPLRNGGVRVAFDQLNEFVPCYAARGSDGDGDGDGFTCFEHLRLRVKDHKSVPGWSLHTNEL